MDKVVSLTVCMILALHYIAGVGTIKCYKGSLAGGLTTTTCSGSCYRYHFDMSSYKDFYGCYESKKDDVCIKGSFWSYYCYCNDDFCNIRIRV